MLTWDYIKQNQVWMVRYSKYDSIYGTLDELKKNPRYQRNEPVDEVSVAGESHQPKELKEYFDAYYFAMYKLNEWGKYSLEDSRFFDDWIKNPARFKPQSKPVIGKLYDIIREYDVNDDMIIQNYDGLGAGNHYVGNHLEAVETDIDRFNFDVVTKGSKYDAIYIEVQTDDVDAFRDFDYESARNANKHDRYLGDGKYGRRD